MFPMFDDYGNGDHRIFSRGVTHKPGMVLKGSDLLFIVEFSPVFLENT